MRGPRALWISVAVTAIVVVSGGHAIAQQAAPLKGEFRPVAHAATGIATIDAGAGGARALRLEDFRVDDGPDLYVYLVAIDDAPNSRSVSRAEFVSLGKLRKSSGDQDYEVPAATDLEKYRTVVIWCKRYSVNFAAAPLSR